MEIDVKFLPKDLEQVESIKDKVCIVLDIFRASSTIITALGNGCTQIRPTLEIGQAWSEKQADDSLLMAGERLSIKIDGFDFGNSPLEFSKELVSDRKLVMNTSNGTKAILACRDAAKVFIGSFINAVAVVKAAMATSRDIIVVCAGTNGSFSLEDSLCAGYLVQLATQQGAQATDIAYGAMLMYNGVGDKLIEHAARSQNGARLYEIGLAADVEYCLTANSSNTVAVYDVCGNIILKI